MPARRNVILLIGDGLGPSALSMARNYHAGAAGRLNIDHFPHVAAATSYAVLEENPDVPDYVTDSAASATAIATGNKTSNRRLSTAPGTGQSLATILELARDAGFRTGLVTNASLVDATPAAFVSHINYRWCDGPEKMGGCLEHSTAAGGAGSVAEQLLATRADLALGGGMDVFEQKLPNGKTVWDQAAELGYRRLRDRAGLRQAFDGLHASERPVLGVFAAENLTAAMQGPLPTQPAVEKVGRCSPAERPADEPTLLEMSSLALRALDRRSASGPGFFLMIEGALIDKRAHDADPCAQIGETIEFDRAVGMARQFAERNPGTLVIVTGDHSHTPLIVDPRYVKYGPGMSILLETPEGGTMGVTYATSYMGLKQQHTGTQLHVAALGPGAERLTNLVDQTDLFVLMRDALGLP